MDDKLPRSIDNEFIRLRNWGGISGLRFIDGGQAVVNLISSDLFRLIRALIEVEEHSVDPDTETLSALKILEQRYFSEDSRLLHIEAIVPIAVNGVRFDPIVDHDAPLLVEKHRLRKEQRSLDREIDRESPDTDA
jgi:hypothetical protein